MDGCPPLLVWNQSLRAMCVTEIPGEGQHSARTQRDIRLGFGESLHMEREEKKVGSLWGNWVLAEWELTTLRAEKGWAAIGVLRGFFGKVNSLERLRGRDSFQ